MRRTAPRVSVWLVLLATIVPVLGLTAARASARPWLGVYTQEITGDLREGLGIDGDGVLVNRVVDGSPADRAGLRTGDVILRFNSRTIHSPSDLSAIVGDAREGQEIALSILRGGDTRTLDVTLAARPSDDREMSAPEPPDAPEAPAPPATPRVMRFHSTAPDAPSAGDEKRREVRVRVERPDAADAPEARGKRKVQVRVVEPGRSSTTREYVIDGDSGLEALPEEARRALDHLGNLHDVHGLQGLQGLQGLHGLDGSTWVQAPGTRARLGVRLEPLTRDLAAALGSPDAHGVLVLESMKDTPAERAGIRAGDIIVSVDGKSVEDADALRKAVQEADGTTAIAVLRHGARQTVQAELGSAPRSSGGEGDGRGPTEGDARVYRFRARDGADGGDLRQQIDELRQQLRELRQQLEERRH